MLKGQVFRHEVRSKHTNKGKDMRIDELDDSDQNYFLILLESTLFHEFDLFMNTTCC